LLKFAGYAGGSNYDHPGAAVEPLCLPKDPQAVSRPQKEVNVERNYIYGAEYETRTFSKLGHLQEHDVPCAVCEAVDKKSVIVIPGKETNTLYIISTLHMNKCNVHMTKIKKTPHII
jgi:hypothetical protein